MRLLPAMLTACALVASCGPGSPGTSVRIALTYDDSLGLDTADVTLTAHTETGAIAHELLLLIPDELAGSEQSIAVWGRKDGQQAAYGTTTVVPARGKTVPAALALTACTPGCDGDNLLTCTGPSTRCMAGCSMDGDAHCIASRTSNGIDPSAADGLQGMTTFSAAATIDTDTGAISGSIERAAGTGVIGGIGYAQAPPFGAGGAPLGIFVFHDLVIQPAATVQVTGTRAAVFLIGGVAIVAGALDLTGGRGARATPGPGGGVGGTQAAAAGGCAPGLPGGRSVENDGGGGGGGGGAGELGVGGTGGGVIPAIAGSGGRSCLPTMLEPLQGGSGGGRGSPGATQTVPSGGGGGGALQITALMSLEVTGTINAGGAGAEGGPMALSDGGGGGGGGSGGAILLEAPILVVNNHGVVAANGGGGGGGGGVPSPGEPGQTGAAVATPVLGGGGVENAANGGSGASATSSADFGGSGTTNAGGGGGGVGAIVLRGHTRTLIGVISPSPIVADLP